MIVSPRQMLDRLAHYGMDGEYSELDSSYTEWSVVKDVLTICVTESSGRRLIATWDLTGLSYKAISGE